MLPFRLRAILLRGHCYLMAQGMTHSKISKTEMLKKAGAITGKTYKRGQHQQAYQDLDQLIKGENDGLYTRG